MSHDDACKGERNFLILCWVSSSLSSHPSNQRDQAVPFYPSREHLSFCIKLTTLLTNSQTPECWNAPIGNAWLFQRMNQNHKVGLQQVTPS